MRSTILVAALAAMTPALVSAHTLNYVADLLDINNLGASGRAELSLDTHENLLSVRIFATGLAPDQTHIQHIHGTFADGPAPDPTTAHGGHAGGSANPGSGRTPSDAVTPTFALGADADGDGFIEVGEGFPFYGDILFNLNDETAGLGGFPTAPGGTIDFFRVYDLDVTTAFAVGFGLSDLLPLHLREIVIHGAFVSDRDGRGTGGEVAGVGGYALALPVLAGELREVAPVPLPAAAWMLLAALGGLGAVRRLRRT